MPKTMTVDFFRVVMPKDAGITFHKLIDQINNLPDDENRNYTRNDTPIRLSRVEIKKNFRQGDMVRIRMDDLPPVHSLNGDTELLDLEDDQGLGEETAFRYYPAYRVLLLQRNRKSVTVSALLRYFEEMGDIDDSIYIEPILESDTLKRLSDMTDIRRFEIGFAGLDKSDILNNMGHGVGTIADLSDKFRSPSITVTLSMGYQKSGSLDKKSVISSIKELLSLSSNNYSTIRKIKAGGREEFGGDIDVLNLLKDRMMEQIDLPSSGRSILYEDRTEGLKSAWRRRRKEIKKMFDKE